MQPRNPANTRARRAALAMTALALVALAPAASSTGVTYYPNQAQTWNGIASNCIDGIITPVIGPVPLLVLQNFVGTPQNANPGWVGIQLTAGSIGCSWNGSLYVVTSSASAWGTAAAIA